jgi:mono/diheme cytochrome c family protein
MILLVIALLLLPLTRVQAQAPASDVQAGKVIWEAFENDCKFCHGIHGEGGFGTALAGHHLSSAQFLHAVREGSGIMPAFADKNMTDQQAGQVAAYLASLPKPSGPPPAWYTVAPPLATARQKLMIATGCGQCHGVTMANPRKTAGGAGADYEWFKKEVWEHTTAPGHVNARHLRMGNYSKQQIPEAKLQELWQFFGVDEGLRVPIESKISAGVASAAGVTYTIEVENQGQAPKGLVAEYLTVTLPLPTGAIPQKAIVDVVATTGGKFIGIHREPITNTEAAEFEIPSLGPGEKRMLTLTLSGSGAEAGIPRGMVKWERPMLNSGGTDQVAVTAPRRVQ